MNIVRILLVQHDPDHRAALSSVLRCGRPHVLVCVAESGEETVRIVHRDGPGAYACIVLDFNLPDCTALELIPVLHRERCNCPIIVCSTSSEQSVVIQSIRQGSADFVPLAEALQGDNLWQRVECVLNRSRRQEARRRAARRAGQLAQLAFQDPLTGLLNRRHLQQFFQDERRKHDRRGRTAVLMLDLDYFKQINDTHGHETGDQVLRVVADLLRFRVTQNDAVYRFGGDEFLILRHNAEYAEDLLWAEAFRQEIADLRPLGAERPVRLTASIGLFSTTGGELGEDAIQKADKALYLAKRWGRNRVYPADLVTFERLVSGICPSTGSNFPAILRAVLDRLDDELGPTQREHLTWHAGRVAATARALGRHLGWALQEVDRLYLAGLGHDLGKLLIPEEILSKPGPLTNAERFLVTRHSADGADMLGLLGADPVACALVRYHHRRFDGADQAGDCVDLVSPGARILAVADAFVAMTSERSYQPRRPASAAVYELQRHSGGQFDPEVVRVVAPAVMAQQAVGTAY